MRRRNQWQALINTLAECERLFQSLHLFCFGIGISKDIVTPIITMPRIASNVLSLILTAAMAPIIAPGNVSNASFKLNFES
ncbi:MAG: hypothetical protein MZV64_15025 [Ignavibacteriales bacterium]|nr:hypothetical protein [Ignavibacteriales bacterium]